MAKHYCAACRSAPASIFCSADAAFLCNVCDLAVHEVNKLARRHARVPLHMIGTQLSQDQSMPQKTPVPPNPARSEGLDESDVSSGFLVVPDMDDMPSLPNTAIQDMNRELPPKLSPQEETSWDLSPAPAPAGATTPAPVPTSSWVPRVPEGEHHRLASIAGAFVKKEAQILLESTSRGQSWDSEVTGALDVSWMADAPQAVQGKSFQPSSNRVQRPPILDEDQLVQTRFSFGDDYERADTARSFRDSLSVREDISIPAEEIGSFQTTNSLGAFERTEEQKRQDRQAALTRFRSKRANRSFRKKVRYECRKQLADSRPRVKGRFVGRSKLAQQTGIQKSGTTATST